ncbi:TetR/AcrR family transcriptional regulator [Deinococcus sonorensis]|uniref:TetR family transcriptional regulator C-terminal domain-containing protein n=2 Tax=Deinococcus sonorensis TaxID=309891 RepID=A0AAU7U5T5_9DEIO
MREQLLETGLDTLHRQGFNGTSVQDITEAAGVPKGSFYNHFESKEALGVAVVRRYVQDRSRHMTILADHEVPPLKRVRRYFAAMAQQAADTGDIRGCLIGNFATELSGQSPVIRQELTHALQGWTDALVPVLVEAQQAQHLSADVSAQELAHLLIDSWEGAVLRCKVEQSGRPLERFLTHTLKRLLV